ncbi:MAG: hypothetical protein CO093_00090 [Alphaproteobacteria bacterium CG_4_9_14_3_um_filter_47_13]|nr:MAG: hypothetical protein CO093_00090 [Alphaproteobacteria bacterium CG_4_9_14_3_um_filter_47_13]
MAGKTAPLSLALEDILKILGENIRLSRPCRKISVTIVPIAGSSGQGMSRAILRVIERGNSVMLI